jgi:hypothetical protein
VQPPKTHKVEIDFFGGGRLLEIYALSLICEFLHFCHVHHAKSGDTGCLWISSTLFKFVFKFILVGLRALVSTIIGICRDIPMSESVRNMCMIDPDVVENENNGLVRVFCLFAKGISFESGCKAIVLF